LKEAVKTMLADSLLPKKFWAEAANTVCYTQNRSLINKFHNKTPYEIYNGRKPSVEHLHAFGTKCFVHNNGKNKLNTFDEKADEGIFLGYSKTSAAFRVYNRRTLLVEESAHVVFDEHNSSEKESILGRMKELSIEDQKDQSEVSESGIHRTLIDQQERISFNLAPDSDTSEPEQIIDPAENQTVNVPDISWLKDHPSQQIIGTISEGVKTRRQLQSMQSCFLSTIEPKKIEEALDDADWISAMQEELNEFERNQVWELISKPSNCNII
jgi:hypothetical protein